MVSRNNEKYKTMDLSTSQRIFYVELAKLVKDYPDMLRYSVEYFRESPPFWSCQYMCVPPPTKRMKQDVEKHEIQVVDLFEGVLQYLQTFSNYFRTKWKWSEFLLEFNKSEHIYSKWLICQCLSTLFFMSEKRRHLYIRKHLGCANDVCSSELRFSKREMNGDFSLSDCIFLEQDKILCEWKKLKSVNEFVSDTVDISGIKLPLVKESLNTNLILVGSTIDNLKGLALAVAAGKPVCLCGPVGCGKTAFVHHIASVTGYKIKNRLYSVQVGEEMDSKLLLGSYKCTDVPGEFLWQPGVLTKAVMSGDWVLFEDIDSATNDVATLLASLMERNFLNVPGYRDNIIPAPGFQLFFTQRIISSVSGYFQQNSTAIEIIRKYWIQLNIEPLNKEELVQLIQVKYPILTTISTKMVDVFLLFSVGSHTEEDCRIRFDHENVFGCRGRLISTRDLLKWCSRSIINYNVASQESALRVLQNGIDLFCCNVANEDVRLKLASAVTTSLGVAKTKAEYFCRIYKPAIVMDGDRCIAGRASLERTNKLIDTSAFFDLSSKFNYATTRPACCLMERVACCLSLNEPVLLVGETGTGKTCTLQLLAKHTGNTLVVLNMNQQSDSTDLLGGYKPIDVKYSINILRNEFEELFRSIFKLGPGNLKFLNHVSICFNNRDWVALIKLMKHVKKSVVEKKKLNDRNKITAWCNLGDKLDRLELQLKHNCALAFAFVEGTLVRAVREGHWVLLDEINLASAETLQCLSSLLEEEGTIFLYEKGDFEQVNRHKQFRLMAAMNPANDVGKKQLPSGIRNRFTEFFVDELTDRVDLITLVACYLQELPANKIDSIAKFYLDIRSEAQKTLCDGIGHKAHYSLRTLCRALSIVAVNPCKNIQRSLYEGFCLSFLTQLDIVSRNKTEKMIICMVLDKKYKPCISLETLRRKLKEITNQLIPEPEPIGYHVYFEGFWVLKGTAKIRKSEKYILTDTVKENLKNLVRVVSLSNHPVLLQGDTSVGKTSLISFLAAASGNKCLRINNHEHTDLQEYVGTYSVDDMTGQLIFKEGVLVEAMRQGYWIILDELNLAPSDVLEALNRVLDENRELYIPETQTTVKANCKFRLFATQNPPGLYGGRKMLSKAFRNRFIELHFGEIPTSELELILEKRCSMPRSYSKKMVAVMKELQVVRKGSAAFQGKEGFVTLRDLFRWGERYRLASSILTESFYDWDQHLADEGYLILAGRVRKSDEADIITKTLEKHIKRKVDINNLFTLTEDTSSVTKQILEIITNCVIPGFEHIVWTYNLRRLLVLVGKAIEFQEPVLLVGDTGCGKTTVCQFIAAVRKQKLLIVNCHQHSESSDFLGGLRPVRQRSANDSKLFEWADGPLIEAMKNGHMFLADEISLTDDSVLERLNSLLEPERTLLLSEKSNKNLQLGEVITAHSLFHFLSTMNPGGDYGKKELSPALRNRLTEIWSENCTRQNDLVAIVEHNVKEGLSLGNQEDGTSGIGKAIVNFLEWFQVQEVGRKVVWSIRDILLWVRFINITTSDNKLGLSVRTKLDIPSAYIHGAHLVFLDGLGTGLTGVHQENVVKLEREKAVEHLKAQVQNLCNEDLEFSFNEAVHEISNTYFGIHPFYIKKGNLPHHQRRINNFTFQAKTTQQNLMRLLRSLQLPGRAILLEGSPGVGKTCLIEALACSCGYQLTRINLSEQTDVSDLFGADLPVDGAEGGVFSWRDGPFLKALKDGHWILLDELNLASQSVLEGLNAVLDHRGELFIPELGRSFAVKLSKTRLFACQNPLKQGGARKGLPASFLNRFTQVYMEPLNDDDILFIIRSLHPEMSTDLINCIVQFSSTLKKECGIKWALTGAPWEINLRDVMRWCEVMVKYRKQGLYDPGRFVSLIYADRMRTECDKQKVLSLYKEIFGDSYPLLKSSFSFLITPEHVILGDVLLTRENSSADAEKSLIVDKPNANLILRRQLFALRSLALCIQMNWFVILVGNSGSGKTSIMHVMAQLCNKDLDVLSVNSAMDTMEILGGFEQVDYNRHLQKIISRTEDALFITLQFLSLNLSLSDKIRELLAQWESFRDIGKEDSSLNKSATSTLASETDLFKKRTTSLLQLVNTLETFDFVKQIIFQIKIDLQKLQEDVSNTGSLNSGGKFEWVDSVLVKCVSEGRWLLVENANLCSPAILDRLNGLLEPNGVLTLGEKGVNDNGNLITIVPHPNFRIFFTVNPQRGEISRAMRNRGVEISLTTIDENIEDNIMDIMAVLLHNGLIFHSMIFTLLDVHFAVRSLNIGLDQPSVDHLIRACFLLVQLYRRHGYTEEDSLKTACIEVYVKSRSLSHDQREIILNEITHKLSSSTEFASTMPLFYRVPNTHSLQYKSSLTLIQSQGMLLLLLLHLFSENHKSSDISDLLFSKLPLSEKFKKNFSLGNLDFHNMLLCCLMRFYEFASPSDAPYRHFWVSEIVNQYLEKSPKISYLTKQSEAVMSLITSTTSFSETQSLDRKSLPWDLRRISSLLFDEVDDAHCNNISLKINYALLKHRCLRMNNVFIDLQNMDINLNQYSDACITENILVRNTTSDLLTNQFKTVCSAFNDFFLTLLDDEQLIMNDNMYGLFLKSFLQYNRFVEGGLMPFFSRISQCVNSYVLNYVRMHFNCLIKQVKTIMALCNAEYIRRLPGIEQILNVFLTIESSPDFALRSIESFSRKLRKKMGQPVPTKVELEQNKNKYIYWILQSARTAEEYPKFRKYLCSILTHMSNSNSNEYTDLDETQIKADHDIQLETTVYVPYKYPIEILPLFEAFYLKFETFFKSVMYSKCTGSLKKFSANIEEEICFQIPSVARSLFIVPSSYVCLLEQPLTDSASKYPFHMNWFIQIIKHLRSFSTFSYGHYLNHRNAHDVCDVESWQNMENILPFHYPVLTSFGCKFIFHSTDISLLPTTFVPSLGDFRNHQVMLQQLKELLWRNSTYLSRSCTSFLFNETQFVLSQFQFLISSISNILDVAFPSDKQISTEMIVHLVNCLRYFVAKKHSEKETVPETLNNFIDLLALRLTELGSLIDELGLPESQNNFSGTWIIIGKCWVLMGTVQYLLFSVTDIIDPVLKINFKMSDCNDDLEFVRCRFAVENMTKVLSGNDGPFLYEELYRRWKENVEGKLETFPKPLPTRREPENYFKIIKNIQQFGNTVGSMETISKLYLKVSKSFDSLDKNNYNVSVGAEAHSVIKECKALLNSSDQFVISLTAEFPEYNDVVTPIVYSTEQINYGLHILSSFLLKSLAISQSMFLLSTRDAEIMQTICIDLCSFPRSLYSFRDLAELCSSQKIVTLLACNQTGTSDYANIVVQLIISCLRNCASVLSIIGISNQDIRSEIWCTIQNLLDQIVSLWKLQEDKRQKQKQDEDNPYVYSTKTLCNTLSEEEENKLLMKAFFSPTFEQDFELDVVSSSLETKEMSSKKKKSEILISDDEMNTIYTIHSELVKNFTYTDWIYPDMQSEETVYSNIVRAFCDRFSVFVGILDKYSVTLDEVVDIIALPGLLLMVDVAEKFSTNEELSDFYHTNDVEQISLFFPILLRIRNHAENLLKMWEDHPVLNSIIIVVDRIMSFEVSSPVSRFLTGADVLLKKLHEWEEVAHSGVSFAVLYEELTGLIFTWRKMEISYWKNALEHVASTIKKGASKWWFHLYSVCSQYISDDSLSFADIVTALQKYIETATVGEFTAKLDLLFVFHCHFMNQSTHPRLRNICHALWNLYFYYKQFEEQVNTQINNLSADVRQKLHNFVKITRWNDINYWSIVKTVEKTHEQLMKYVKEFQKILSIPVTTAMTYLSNKNTEIENLLVNKENFEHLYNSGFSAKVDASFIEKANLKFIVKAKKFCKSIILSAKYPTLLLALNMVVQSVNEDVEILNKMDIDRKLEKEKQKSQAKQLLQQKRKTVADLFKIMTRLGLSYRSGLVIAGNENFSISFANLKPLDIDALRSPFKNSPTEVQLMKAWEGCANTFSKSIAKQSQLKVALEKPHQDLGLQITDRVKGFSYHLLDVNLDERRKVGEIVENLRDLKTFKFILSELYEGSYITNNNMENLKDEFMHFLHETIYFLQQFLILLNCCPEKSSTILKTPVLNLDLNCTLLQAERLSSVWTEVCDKIKSHIKILEMLKSRFYSDIILTCNNIAVYGRLITRKQYVIIIEECDTLLRIREDLKSIRSLFGLFDHKISESLCSKLVYIEKLFDHVLELVAKRKEDPFIKCNDACRYQTKIQKLMNVMLVSIQKLFKKYRVDENNYSVIGETFEELRENHLKGIILKSLNEDIDSLSILYVCKQSQKILEAFLKNCPPIDAETRKSLFGALIPLFNQYCLLVEYVITQYIITFKVSTNLCCSLLDLFIQLTTKGFCIPLELLENEKGNRGSKNEGGMGLEDGEGIKDVSDEIETQDQLEGANKPGHDETEEQVDCKEEKNGVEMSEDFGGKSQSLENEDNENDVSENDDNEEELEKEMGEIEEGAETLDQEIWNTDTENEDESEEPKENETDDGRGEPVGDKKLCAKDESTKEYEEQLNDKDGMNGNEQKEINEMKDQQTDDDQIDPYHGKQDPFPEPEVLDLPDDLQLDDGEAKEDEINSEIPFDIDNMKELMPPKEESIDERIENENNEEDNEETASLNDDNDDDVDNVGSKKDEGKTDENEGEADDEFHINESETGGSKDEDQVGDELEPEHTQNEEKVEPQASKDKPCQTEAQPSKEDEGGSKDMVGYNEEANNEKVEEEVVNQDSTGIEQQGVGQAEKSEIDTSEGHSSTKTDGSQSYEKGNQKQKRKLKPGKSDINRTLAEANEPSKKRLKTIDEMEQPEDENNSNDGLEEKHDESSLYRHIRESEKGTSETVDAATQEQAEQQPVINDGENAEEATNDDELDLEESEYKEEQEDTLAQKSDKMKTSKKETSKIDKEGVDNPEVTMERNETEVEGDYVETMVVERGLESTFYTHTMDEKDEQPNHLTLEYIEDLKKKLQENPSTWSQITTSDDAFVVWELFSAMTASLSQELSEQLRLVLEPTQASRLKGDFRTGRRINMRKVIPYIASHFRKDKIWLRRTKPSKREYQIILAIDNSASMADNHTKELAFQSVALVSKALSLIEAGELGILSFGERTKIVHPLGEPFTSHTGARCIRDFTFDENRTKYADAVHTAHGMFLARGSRSHSCKSAQLLVIISDGRLVTSEGVEVVKTAVRTARQSGVFIVFIIVENPKIEKSILDVMSVSVAADNKTVIQSYMETFPFPFYLLLRDINKLPAVLAEALQQWFELVTSNFD